MKIILKRAALLTVAALILTMASGAVAQTAAVPAKCDKASCEKCAGNCAQVTKCLETKSCAASEKCKTACKTADGKHCQTVCAAEDGKHCQVVCKTADGKECNVNVCQVGSAEACKVEVKCAEACTAESCKKACEAVCSEAKGAI